MEFELKPCRSIDKRTKMPCEKQEGHIGYHTREIVWSDEHVVKPKQNTTTVSKLD